MADALRKTIRAAVLSRLEGINGAGGGYNNTIGQSGPTLIHFVDVSADRAAFVGFVRGTREPNQMAGDAGDFMTKLEVLVRCVTKGVESMADMDNWVGDVVKAVEQAPLNLNAAWITEVHAARFEPVVTDEGIHAGLFQEDVIFAIEYLTNRAVV